MPLYVLPCMISRCKSGRVQRIVYYLGLPLSAVRVPRSSSLLLSSWLGAAVGGRWSGVVVLPAVLLCCRCSWSWCCGCGAVSCAAALHLFACPAIVRLPCWCWSWWLVSLPLVAGRCMAVGCRLSAAGVGSCRVLAGGGCCCRWWCLSYCHGWRLWLFPFFGWVLLWLLVWRLGLFLWCRAACGVFGCCVPSRLPCAVAVAAVRLCCWCRVAAAAVGVVCCWRLLGLVLPVLAAVLLCSLAAVLHRIGVGLLLWLSVFLLLN